MGSDTERTGFLYAPDLTLNFAVSGLDICFGPSARACAWMDDCGIIGVCGHENQGAALMKTSIASYFPAMRLYARP